MDWVSDSVFGNGRRVGCQYSTGSHTVLTQKLPLECALNAIT
jgi:hypothetical protein